MQTQEKVKVHIVDRQVDIAIEEKHEKEEARLKLPYEERVTEFDNLYGPFELLDMIAWHDLVEDEKDKPRCAACGSHMPKGFHWIEGKKGQQFYVGCCCYEKLTETYMGRCQACHRNRRVITWRVVDKQYGAYRVPLCDECKDKYIERLEDGDIKLYRSFFK